MDGNRLTLSGSTPTRTHCNTTQLIAGMRGWAPEPLRENSPPEHVCKERLVTGPRCRMALGLSLRRLSRNILSRNTSSSTLNDTSLQVLSFEPEKRPPVLFLKGTIKDNGAKFHVSNSNSP